MKRIEIEVEDADAPKVIAGLAEHKLDVLSMHPVERPPTWVAEQIALYLERRGRVMQANGIRNAKTSTEMLAAEIRAGEWEHAEFAEVDGSYPLLEHAGPTNE